MEYLKTPLYRMMLKNIKTPRNAFRKFGSGVKFIYDFRLLRFKMDISPFVN